MISALGQIDDVARAVTMDLKQAGNTIYIVGDTRNEMGGSHFALVHNLKGGHVPRVDPVVARDTFAAVHRAIDEGLVRACHDLSEGGLAVAIAEMAFAGGLGAAIELGQNAACDQLASGNCSRAVGRNLVVRRIEYPVPVRSAGRPGRRIRELRWPVSPTPVLVG